MTSQPCDQRNGWFHPVSRPPKRRRPDHERRERRPFGLRGKKTPRTRDPNHQHRPRGLDTGPKVERRPVTDARPVTNADFTDKVVEMTETDEEAVISKTARVREEVVVRKDATERTETVRDTVRREDVEITKEPGVAPSTSTAGVMPVAPTPKI